MSLKDLAKVIFMTLASCVVFYGSLFVITHYFGDILSQFEPETLKHIGMVYGAIVFSPTITWGIKGAFRQLCKLG